MRKSFMVLDCVQSIARRLPPGATDFPAQMPAGAPRVGLWECSTTGMSAAACPISGTISASRGRTAGQAGASRSCWLVVFWGFGKYLIPYEKPKPQIIYFENWKADRSEAEVRADWIARAKETTRENARRRADYQKLDDMMGVNYDSSKAH